VNARQELRELLKRGSHEGFRSGVRHDDERTRRKKIVKTVEEEFAEIVRPGTILMSCESVLEGIVELSMRYPVGMSNYAKKAHNSQFKKFMPTAVDKKTRLTDEEVAAGFEKARKILNGAPLH